MINPIKNKHGFSKMELIVILAVVGIFTGFVMQFFIKADDMNGLMTESNKAVIIAENHLEEFKSLNVPPNNGENKDEVYYLNSFWNVVTKDHGYYEVSMSTRKQNINVDDYILESVSSSSEVKIYNQLYKKSVVITRLNDARELVNFSTMKYFVYK